MRPDVKKDLSDSAYDFKRLSWPIVRNWLGGGELISVETVTDSKFTYQLDILAGIDAWQILQKKGIRGIASRVQWVTKNKWDKKPWKSFTQRASRTSGAKTELYKRLNAIKTKEGWLYPEYVVHSYSTQRRTGDLLYICMVRIIGLYSYIDYRIRNNSLELLTNPVDGNLFTPIWVEDLQNFGIRVYEWLPKEQLNFI